MVKNTTLFRIEVLLAIHYSTIYHVLDYNFSVLTQYWSTAVS